MIKKYFKLKPFYALLCASIVFGSVILDCVTKKLIMATMQENESVPIIKNVLNLTYIRNEGAAFGSFSDHRWVFMVLSSIMIVALIVIIAIWDRQRPMFYISASLVLGGGIGNMIDRIAYGWVVDFIDFCAFPKLWMWIFNFADVCVCIGSALLIFYYITDIIMTSVKTKAAAEGAAEAENALSVEADSRKSENEPDGEEN